MRAGHTCNKNPHDTGVCSWPNYALGTARSARRTTLLNGNEKPLIAPLSERGRRGQRPRTHNRGVASGAPRETWQHSLPTLHDSGAASICRISNAPSPTEEGAALTTMRVTDTQRHAHKKRSSKTDLVKLKFLDTLASVASHSGSPR
jgi:hypothetical protein